MNILMLLSQREVTGAEVYAAALTDGLIERGHNVWICSDTFTKPTKAAFTPLPLNNRSWGERWRQVRFVVRFLRENKIDVVHAHSRAAGWVGFVATRIARVPLVTTVHGKQPTHVSRKLVKAFGEYALPICEAVRDNIVHELGVDAHTVEIVRNGVSVPSVVPSVAVLSAADTPTIALVGRLSQQKGELALRILETLMPLLERRTDVRMVVIGGNTIPPAFDKFRSRVEFTGYVEDVPRRIAKSSVVLGAGRSAVEALLLGKPTVAVGEARVHGLVSAENLADVLHTNFGDIAAEHRFDAAALVQGVEAALQRDSCDETVRERVRQQYSLERLVQRVEAAYQRALVVRHRFEVPVLTYHRVVRRAEDGGTLPIYVTVQQMEDHLRMLKEQGFQTLTCNQLLHLPLAERVPNARNGRKYALLTFDDGYKDNYTLLFPLLQRYGMNATIFLVAGRETNAWDSSEHTGLPPLPLMSAEQAREMQHYGIEFGSHSMTHPRLTECSPEAVRWELQESKRLLEERLGREVSTFCYPYGAVNAEVKQLVAEAGYRLGIASDSGSVFVHEDVMEIRRIGVFPNTDNRGFLRKIAGDYTLRKRSSSLALTTAHW